MVHKKTEKCLLVSFPGRLGYSHRDRFFPSIADAVKTLEAELGCRVIPMILEIEFVRNILETNTEGRC